MAMIQPPYQGIPPADASQATNFGFQSSSGFGPQTGGIPPPGVVSGISTVPNVSQIPQVQSLMINQIGGMSTPPNPIMMVSGMGQPAVYQADQSGPVFTGPGATREKTVFKLCKVSKSQSDQIARAKKYAMEQSIKTVLITQTLAHQQQQQINFQTNVQKQQALALMCRIYVGSINFEIKEDTIKQAFQPFGPIKSVSLSWDSVANKHKGFAFVEYDIPEAASLAMEQMNGVMIGGRNIKVGRPTNMPQAQPIIEQLKEDSKKFYRIFVASVHPDLNNNDVKSVFEAFGPIKNCALEMDAGQRGQHKGFGFIEYANAQSAEDAVSSMNLFDLGGMFLRVGKAVTPPDTLILPTMGVAAQPPGQMPTAAAIAAAAVTAQLKSMETEETLNVVTSSANSEPERSHIIAPPQLATTVPPVGLAVPVLSSQVGGSIPTPSVASIQPPRLASLQPPVMASIPAPGVATIPAAGLGIIPPPPLPGGVQATQHSHQQEHAIKEDNTIGAQENLQISGRDARHLVMHKLMRQSDECKVCVLRNMVGPEDVDEDLQHEVEEECSNYGQVERVIIYQEKQGEEDDAEIIVKIFVEFSATSEVEAAVNSLHGRYFAGRIVKAEKYSQELYQADDYTH